MTDHKILVVDDEEELAENMADLLELEGYDVDVCFSGEEALKTMNEQSYSLVLLDIQMTGIDGLEVLRMIKEKKPNLPVFMVSASSQKGTKEKISEYGGDAMILKPYDQDELLALIAKFLNKES